MTFLKSLGSLTHPVYSVRYSPRFPVFAVGLGTYYLWIREHYYIYIYIDGISNFYNMAEFSDVYKHKMVCYIICK
jgi:hypothetical protein